MPDTATPPATPAAAAAAAAAPAAPAPTLESLAADMFKTPLPDAPKQAPAPTPKADLPPAAETPKAQPVAEEKKKPSVFDKLPTAKTQAPEKTADAADPFAHIKPPENMSEKAATNWNLFKQEATAKILAAEKKAAEHAASLETYRKATPAEAAESQRLKEELQRAHDRLAVLDLQSHPEFTAKYVEPKNRALQEAGEVLQFNEVRADLPALLAKSPKEFSAAVSDLTKTMNPMDATTVQQAMRQAYKLQADEKTALSKSGELHQQLRERSAALNKKAFDESYQALGLADGMFEPVEIPDDATPEEKAELQAMNEAFQQIRPIAEKNAFSASTPKELASIAQKSALLDVYIKTVIPRMDKEHRSVVAERDALRAELKAIKDRKNPGTFAGDPAGAGGPPANENLDQMATRMFSQATR